MNRADALKWLRTPTNHHMCEDSWYSCPKSEEGCSDDRWSDGTCTCGADELTAKHLDIAYVLDAAGNIEEPK